MRQYLFDEILAKSEELDPIGNRLYTYTVGFLMGDEIKHIETLGFLVKPISTSNNSIVFVENIENERLRSSLVEIK